MGSTHTVIYLGSYISIKSGSEIFLTQGNQVTLSDISIVPCNILKIYIILIDL